MPSYKPGDFFLGIIDFFGILLPGAVFLFLQSIVASEVLGYNILIKILAGPFELQFSNLPAAVQWVAFLFGAYLFGYLLFEIGRSLFESPTMSTRMREWEARRQKKQADSVASGDDPLYKHVLQRIDFPEYNDMGEKEKNSFLKNDRTKVFHRAFSYVRLNGPDAIAEIERQTAVYKLFRTMTIVLLLESFFTLIFVLVHLISWALGSKFCFPDSGLIRLFVMVPLTLIFAWHLPFRRTWAENLTFEFFLLIKYQKMQNS